MAGPYKPVGVDSDSLFPPRVETRLAGNISEMIAVGEVNNAIGEWWTNPLAVRDSSRGRVVGGAVSANKGDGTSDIIVWERTDAGVVRRYAIGTATTDDHNVPAVVMLPWGGVLVTWNDHNRDHIVRAKVSNRSGDLVSLTQANLFQFDAGFDISYGQLFIIDHLSTATEATVWQISRLYRGDGWAWEIVPLTITQDGNIARGAVKRLISTGLDQGYASVVDAHSSSGQKLRVGVGFNPAASRHEVYAFEVDVQTGAITSPVDDAFTANVSTATNVPIVVTAQAPLIADVAVGDSRRLFYTRPGPSPWGIAYADWSSASPDAAEYKILSQAPGAFGLSTNSGYASTPDVAAYDATTIGWSVRLIGLKLGVSSISGDRELSRKWLSAADRQYQLRITQSGFLKVNVTREGNNAADYLSTAVIPNLFTAEVSIMVRVLPSTSGGTIKFYTSSDLGQTWTQLGADVSIGNYATVSDTTGDLVAGSTVAASQVPMTLREIAYASWDGAVETDLARMDWATQSSSSPAYVDSIGRMWVLSGDAIVVQPWSTSSLGTAGPRVGYTAAANYIGGISFPDPCQADDPVLVARRNAANTQSAIERWTKTSNDYIFAELVAESPFYLARPTHPYGGGPLIGIWSQITNYSPTTYDDYDSTIRMT